MTLPRIIGIAGFARHGKGTVAGVLERELGYSHVNLADALKTALLVLNPFIETHHFPSPGRLATLVKLVGWDDAKKEPEVRRLLQVFGTEVGREMFGQDIWIETLARNTKGFYDSERKIVISDVRFPNEVAFIRKAGGEVWKVTRPDFDNGVGPDHASERYVPTIRPDFEFINVGSKANFQDIALRGIKNRMATVSYPTDHEKRVEQMKPRVNPDDGDAY